MNYLFRLVSGNYKNYELNNNNIYEYLYINILNLLHSKIFSELTKNPQHKMVQYHYIEPESFKEISQLINNGGRNIFSIIDSIIQNNNYIALNKKHPLLWLDLSLIKLFFSKIEIIQNNSEENINILAPYDIICEAFDKADMKAMLVNAVLENFPDKYLISGNGMAGFGSSNDIVTRRLSKKFYICGDGKSDISDGIGLVSARVAVCAAHQANMILRIIAGFYDA